MGAMNAGGASRVWVIAAIIVLHALLFWSWRHGRLAAGPDMLQREIQVTLVPARPSQVAAERPRPRSAPVAVARRARSQEIIERAAEPLPVPEAITLLPAPDPFAEQAPAPAARPAYDIGKIDKEVRRQSLNPAVRDPVLLAPKMERLIGAAKTQRGPPVVEELVLSDGTRVSKVGRMCAQKRSSAMVGGYDAFKNGNETLWRQCPK